MLRKAPVLFIVFFFLSFQAVHAHAADLIVTIVEVDFALPLLRVEAFVQHKSTNQRHRFTLTTSNAPVTSANFVPAFKLLLIDKALTQFGVTLTSTDILVFGAPQ